MAIAGSTQEAFFLRLEGDRLVEVGKHRIINHLIEEDVDQAIAKLKAGKAVYLLAYSDNLAKVKGAFSNGTQTD